MPHRTERKEKNCLNCNAMVKGRYCQECGQENIIPQESFGHLVLHFIYDITHFDGKFSQTLKLLVFRPGFLSREYIAGKRVRYLNPVRMYIFTSALFFLFFFAITSDNVVKFTGDRSLTEAQRDSLIVEMQREISKNPADSSPYRTLAILRDTSRKSLRLADLMAAEDGFAIVGTWGQEYRSYRAYDSLQKILPASERDSWLKRMWNRRALALKDKYGHDPRQGVKYLIDSFLQKLPYLLFVSLPLFALILKILYGRHRNILFAGHSIFAIHQYIFSFILILFLLVFNEFEKLTGWPAWGIMQVVLMIVWLIHVVISLKRFYAEGWLKTIVKMVLLNTLGTITLIALFVAFALFAVFQI